MVVCLFCAVSCPCPAESADFGLGLDGAEDAESRDEFGLGLDGALADEVPPFTLDRNEVPDWKPPPSTIERKAPRLYPKVVEQPRPFPARVPGDFVALLKAPVSWDDRDWRRLGLGVVAVGAAVLLDGQINSWIEPLRTDAAIRAAETIRPIGTEGGLVLMGAAWLAGRQFDRPEVTAMAEDGLEAVAFSAGIITPLLKALSGRVRPRSSDDSLTFNRSSQSFPSGETTMVFAMASVVAAHSNRWWIDAIAWSTAGLIGFERLILDAHWSSDVVAGALIGTAVGQWVVRRNRPEFENRLQMDILPTFGVDHVGVSVHLRF
jgi:membrane-associated phospholipid phosphatase